jgi:hypothetical protein
MTTWTGRMSACVLALGAVVLADPAQAQSVCAPGSLQLIIYHAGSLAAFTADATKSYSSRITSRGTTTMSTPSKITLITGGSRGLGQTRP